MMYWGALYLLIPILGVVAWGTHRVVREVYQGKAQVAASGHDNMKQALDDAAATNRQVLAKLESLESRLANVEKTLNDIPS